MIVWRLVEFQKLISRHWCFFAHFEVRYDSIILMCILLESYWNCTSFGGNFSQVWVVLAKLWLFEGWLSFRSWFEDFVVLLHILRSNLIRSFLCAYCWKGFKIAFLLVVVLLKFELYWPSYDRLKVGWVLEVDCKRRWLTSIYCKTGRCSTSCSIVRYIIYAQPIRLYPYKHDELHAISKELNKMFVANWSGNISELLIPSSSPHKFHERNLHICKDIWNIIYLHMWSNIKCVYFHEALHYYEKEIHLIILLNFWHLDNMSVFSFSNLSY